MKAMLEGASKQNQKQLLFVGSSTVHNYPQIISCKEKVTAKLATSFQTKFTAGIVYGITSTHF